MDNKKFESPEEVLRLIDQIFEPLELALHNFAKVTSPIVLSAILEFEKWNVSSVVLGKAG